MIMDTGRLDLNLLVTLEALLAERNVTRAAARLNLSQPAISAQLKRLRDVFADPLLIPAHRGMMPTAKALALMEEMRPALDALRAAFREQSFDPATATATLTIACSDYSQSVVLVPLILHLRKVAPKMRLAVKALSPTALTAELARGEADLALMTPELAPPDLHFAPLFAERYVLIGRQGHPKLKRNLSLDDYLALDHVMVSPSGGGFETPVDRALAAQGLSRKVVLSLASFLIVMEVVARSDFVALVPQGLLGRDQGLRAVPPPFPVEGFTLGMVWHPRNHTDAAQRWLRTTVAAVAKATRKLKKGSSSV